MKSHHFCIGNSGEGPIGLCACIVANSKKEALSRLQEALGGYTEGLEVDADLPDRHPDEYVSVYVGERNITVADIDEESEVSS